VSYKTEEQQVEDLKEWWKDNGTPLIVGAVLGLSGFFGWKFYSEKQVAYQVAASDRYLTVTEELEKDDKTQLIENANAVKTDFPDSTYSVLSAFQLAKIAVVKNDLDAAASELDWVITNHPNNELTAVAKIRLARILIAQQKSEQALSLLSFDSDSGYFEVASLIRGNALMALGKKAEALEAYKTADNLSQSTANHPTLKLAIEKLTSEATSSAQVSPIESTEKISKESKKLETANDAASQDDDSGLETKPKSDAKPELEQKPEPEQNLKRNKSLNRTRRQMKRLLNEPFLPVFGGVR